MNTLNQYIINEAIEEYQARIYNREYQPLRIGENQLLEIFPETKKLIPDLITEYETRLESLNIAYQASLTRLMGKEYLRNDKQKAEIAALIIYILCFEEPIRWLEKNLKRLYRIQRVMRGKNKEGQITDDDIVRAKETPIPQFINFNRAWFAPCIWHTEKTPSMHWYQKTNKVKCFGCNKSGDTIDVVMAKNQVDFIPAVKIIIGR